MKNQLLFDTPLKTTVYLAWVVRKMDNAIHSINHSPLDSMVCFDNTCLLDSHCDLCDG